MKKKLIIALIIISAIFLFSMQLCTLIFGNKPTVNITYPADGATISDTAITVTGTINDLDGDATKVKVWITDTVLSGWDYDVSSGQFSVNLDLTSLASGNTYTVCAQGYDANNNISDTISVSFTYNGGGGGGSAPVVTITYPANGTTISDTAITVTGTINDLDGDATKVKVWITDTVLSGWDYDVSSGQFSVNLDLTSLTSGTHIICAQGYDANNNVSDTVAVNFTYNGGGGGGSAPVVTITYPANGTTISDTAITVTGTINDLDGDATKVKVWITDTVLSGWDYDVSSGQFSVNLDLTSLTSGTHIICAQGYDANNNISDTISISFTYNGGGGGGSAPVVTITSPTEGAIITNSSLTISGTITDADEDKSHITAIVQGYPAITNTTSNIYNVYYFDIILDLSSLSSGQYTIEVIGYDLRNNASEPKYVTINYSPGSSNLLLNGYFTDSGWFDNDITYSDGYIVGIYLNQPNDGDFLPYWTFFIWVPEEDYPKIDISSGSVKMYTTNPNSNGSAMGMTQDTSSLSDFKTGSGKTIKIKFRIDSFAGGSCVSPYFEAPVKINIISGGSDYTIAAFTTNTLIKDGGYGFGGLQTQTNLEYEFTLPTTALNGTTIPLDQQITALSIWCNGWTWDVTIYSIEVY